MYLHYSKSFETLNFTRQSMVFIFIRVF